MIFTNISSGNVLHATIGGNNTENGDNTPSVYYNFKTSLLTITSGINGHAEHITNVASIDPFKWTKIEIQQKLVNARRCQAIPDNYEWLQKNGPNKSCYIYSIRVNDKHQKPVHLNKLPRSFKNVKLFASDHFSPSASSKLDSIIFETTPDDSLIGLCF